MTETASTTANTARRRPDRRFAGGLPWDSPSPDPGMLGGSAPIVLPERAKPKPVPTPSELEAQGRRTAAVAHDFNNLLSVITVCAGEIAEGSEGEIRERAEEIRDAAQRGAELTSGLLAEERAFAAGSPTSGPGPLAAGEAIRGSLKLIERALGPSISVELHSADAMPRVALAAADLERILLNLAANSRDALPDGGAVAISAETVAVAPGDPRLGTGLHVRISFGDNGAGMSPGVAARALDPFFSTKDQSGGSRGLGLAGAVAIARAAGGDLRINSRPEVGTVISIYLPAIDAAGEPLALPAPA